jgi:hypothetical protein
MRKVDVLVASVLTVWMVAEVRLEHLHPAVPGAALMVVGGASLAWRRVYPILVGATVAGMGVVQAALGMSMHTAVAPVIGILLASWSIGAHEERRRAIPGLILLVCLIWLSIGIDVIRGTDNYSGTDIPACSGRRSAPGREASDSPRRGRRSSSWNGAR